MANGIGHETFENPAMTRHSLAILADRPEVGPCLSEYSDNLSVRFHLIGLRVSGLAV
jgi:hypothetical protein